MALMAFSEQEADLVREVERLRQWIADLQSGMFINCVYCGHRFGPEKTTPASMADVLKAHVERCPAHPMARLKVAAVQAKIALDFVLDLLQAKFAGESVAERLSLVGGPIAERIVADAIKVLEAA